MSTTWEEYTIRNKWRQGVADLFKLDKGKCVYCDKYLYQSYKIKAYYYHIDHILPKSGFPEYKDEIWNHALCCHSCNKIKGRWKPEFKELPTLLNEKKYDEVRNKLVEISREFIKAKLAKLSEDFEIEQKTFETMISEQSS